jgi:hypothetical protein
MASNANALVHLSVCQNGQRLTICNSTSSIINFVNDYLNTPVGEGEQRAGLDVLIISSELPPNRYKDIPHCSYICDMTEFNAIFFKNGIEIENLNVHAIGYLGLSDSVYNMLDGLDDN